MCRGEIPSVVNGVPAVLPVISPALGSTRPSIANHSLRKIRLTVPLMYVLTPVWWYAVLWQWCVYPYSSVPTNRCRGIINQLFRSVLYSNMVRFIRATHWHVVNIAEITSICIAFRVIHLYGFIMFKL